MTNRGGARPGSGRKPKHGVNTKSKTLTMPMDLIERLEAESAESGKSVSEIVTGRLVDGEKCIPNPTKTAYSIINRAKELGPSMVEKYSNEVNVTFDEDALVKAIVEQMSISDTGESK